MTRIIPMTTAATNIQSTRGGDAYNVDRVTIEYIGKRLTQGATLLNLANRNYDSSYNEKKAPGFSMQIKQDTYYDSVTGVELEDSDISHAAEDIVTIQHNPNDLINIATEKCIPEEVFLTSSADRTRYLENAHTKLRYDMQNFAYRLLAMESSNVLYQDSDNTPFAKIAFNDLSLLGARLVKMGLSKSDYTLVLESETYAKLVNSVIGENYFHEPLNKTLLGDGECTRLAGFDIVSVPEIPYAHSEKKNTAKFTLIKTKILAGTSTGTITIKGNSDTASVKKGDILKFQDSRYLTHIGKQPLARPFTTTVLGTANTVHQIMDSKDDMFDKEIPIGKGEVEIRVKTVPINDDTTKKRNSDKNIIRNCSNVINGTTTIEVDSNHQKAFLVSKSGFSLLVPQMSNAGAKEFTQEYVDSKAKISLYVTREWHAKKLIEFRRLMLLMGGAIFPRHCFTLPIGI